MYSNQEIFKELKKLRTGRAFRDEPLSRHTTLKIGGPADILVIPKDIRALQDILHMTKGVKKIRHRQRLQPSYPRRRDKGDRHKNIGGVGQF